MKCRTIKFLISIFIFSILMVEAGFVSNDPVNKYDSLGLAPSICGVDSNGKATYCENPPNSYYPLPDLPLAPLAVIPPKLTTNKSCDCCKNMADAIVLANKAMGKGKCKKWFTDRNVNGRNFKVRCYGYSKIPVIIGFPAWTSPFARRIGFNKNKCENDTVVIASLLIHEVAHHYSTILWGREESAMSAQDACSSELME